MSGLASAIVTIIGMTVSAVAAVGWIQPSIQPTAVTLAATDYSFPVTPVATLVTNEFAYWNPSDPGRIASQAWEMTSGSLFSIDGHGWSGVPDAVAPDARSSNGTGSAIFRLNTTRFDYRDVSVSFMLQNRGYVSTDVTPPLDWDGVNVWLRYQDEYDLYAVHVNRRDGTAKIERKVPGGSANNGTYFTIATGTMAEIPAPDEWQAISVSVVDVPDGVRISAWQNGAQIVSGIDDGSFGASPITNAGAVGIRGDNTDFLFDSFSVGPASGD